MKILLIISTIIIAVFFTFTNDNNVKEANYILLKEINDIEIRKYSKSLNASYHDNSKENRNNYFKNLAAYIFGENDKSENISMTSPVTMKLHGNKEMIFRMPEKYSINTIPKPNNNEIKIFEIEPCIKAAIKYGGYSNKRIEEIKIEQLKNTLLKNNLTHDNKFEVLVYNSPYKILNRKNEITVNLTNF